MLKSLNNPFILYFRGKKLSNPNFTFRGELAKFFWQANFSEDGIFLTVQIKAMQYTVMSKTTSYAHFISQRVLYTFNQKT